MSISLTDTELLRLFDELKDAVIREGQKEDKNFKFKISDVFYKADIPGVSLNYLLRNTSPSREYIQHLYDTNESINSRKFYNTYLDVKKKKWPRIEIDETLANAISLFIGYDDIQHFLQQFEEEAKEFKGLFYSPHSNQIIQYNLWIQKVGNGFRLKVQGIHEQTINRTFEGEGVWNSDSWVLEAKLSSGKGEPMFFLINMSNQEFVSHFFLEAITLTVTASQRLPVTFYSLLVSKDRFNALTGREIKYIKRYLMMRQDIFSVGNTNISSWQDLTIRGREMQMLNDMVGVFEIWRFTDEQKILITRLQIDDEFNGKFQNTVLSEGQTNEFDCRFDLSTGTISRLCVTVLQDRSKKNPLVFALIDLISEIGNTKYYFGSFCSISNNKIEARPMVLMRREPGYEHFDSELISYEEAIRRSEESYEYAILLDKLKEVAKDHEVNF